MTLSSRLRCPAERERWISTPQRIEATVITGYRCPRPVVHLELHTGNELQAGAFYRELLDWRPERVRTASSSYLAIDFGGPIGGGMVECGTRRPLWLPYVEVDRVEGATEHARRLGATVILEPCEGPSGWRSVVSSPVAGEVALWELKR
jgi:predicted enzyme related to lactoylglutathione lyase